MSIPPEPGQPVRRPVLEPTYVQRRRRTEALAELLRQVREDERDADPDENYESVPVAARTRLLPPMGEDETEELPPVPAGEDYAGGGGTQGAGQSGRSLAHGRRPGRGEAVRRGHGLGLGRDAGLRRAAITVAVTAAALVGFALALLLPRGAQADAPQTGARPPTTPAAQTPSPAADPDGAGTLREGDSGPEVTELQERLLRIPNVYDNGNASGTYDATLTAAVARFQLWYGIRGDETGVYGDDTRADLESRATP
ncbi:peptidoglycan-binding protein [Streptomyces sp. NPDC001530]|uniref:peptidoglycan-binding domain-containing protein n=1 Tax=Streptomyces sp. NPDC001530 TaxID=3364582 RepID=UPI00368F8851